jgi:hypothetical protein
MLPKQCPSPDELRVYALGDTCEDVAVRIEEHLARCVACEETLANFDSADDTLVRHLPLAAAADQEPEAGWLARLREDVPHRGEDADAPVAGGTVDLDAAEHNVSAREFLGSYRLLARIGRGGMGVVYRALHTQLDRVAAVKVLAPHLVASARARARFDREIQVIGRLDHPGIVRATDAGRVGRTAYLVMEYVEGVDLARLVRRGGPLPVCEACEAARQVAEALAAAHQLGAVHRDVKPSNLIVDRSGQVKLLDFGLARLSAEADDGQHSTQGRVVGTLDYMAPEQAGGGAIDHRADLYGLGATLFFLLTGKSPHGDSEDRPLLAQLRHIAEQDPPRVSELRPDVPADVEELVARLLSRRPEDRPASGEEVATMLSPFAGGDLVRRVAEIAPAAADARRTDSEEVARAEASLAEQLGEEFDEDGAVPAKRTSEKIEPATRRFRALPLVTVGIAAAFLFIASLGLVLFVQTPEGTLRIESDADDVRVELIDDQGKKVESLEIQKGDKETVLRAGRYRVRLAGGHDSLQVTPDEFTLLAGKEVVARIRYEKAAPVEPLDPSFAMIDDASAGPIDQIFARIEEALARRSWEKTATAGGAGGEEFEDLPQSPRLLIGFKATKSTFFAGLVTIKSLQPIYRTPGGVVEGPRIGRPFRKEVELTARDGYAVGAMIAKSGQRIDGFKLRFMRITAGGLDPSDAYDSDWFGGKRGSDETMYGDGRPIIGLFGRQGANVDRMGLLIAALDPDLWAAEWVLSIGGSVGVNGDDPDIRQAGELPQGGFRLTSVILKDNPQASDGGLAHFEGCKNLTYVALGGTPVSDAGLAYFRDCNDLRRLNLGRTQVSDAGLAHFQDCQELTSLYLYRTRVSDAGLAHFKDCTNLATVILGDTQVSDAGLAHLVAMVQLRNLTLINTKVTPQGVADLHNKMPQCRIEWDGGVLEP